MESGGSLVKRNYLGSFEGAMFARFLAGLKWPNNGFCLAMVSGAASAGLQKFRMPADLGFDSFPPKPFPLHSMQF